jgi:hypothetical protein
VEFRKQGSISSNFFFPEGSVGAVEVAVAACPGHGWPSPGCHGDIDDGTAKVLGPVSSVRSPVADVQASFLC